MWKLKNFSLTQILREINPAKKCHFDSSQFARNILQVRVNYLFFHTVFTKFSATLILREINFNWFQRVKNCIQYFWILIFGQFLIFSNMEFPKNQDSKPPKWIKWQFLTFWNQPKLISRKMTVAGKLPNFHNVVKKLT